MSDGEGPDVEQLSAQYEQIQRQLQALERHLAELEQSVKETRSALETLKGLQDGDAADTLVSIGGGVRLPARVDPAEPVMVALGNGYHAQRSIADARQDLQARLERTEAAHSSASQDAEKLAGQAQQIVQTLQSAQMAESPS